MVLNLFEDYENKSCKQTGRLCANHRERLIENVFIFLFKSCFSDILILFCKRFAFCCSLRPYILQPTSLQHNIVIILVTFSHPFNPPPPPKEKARSDSRCLALRFSLRLLCSPSDRKQRAATPTQRLCTVRGGH